MKHPFRWLIGAALLGLAVQPVLLPHPGWVQAVVGGAAGAQGYALAALGGVLLRRIPRPAAIRTPVTVRPIVTAALGAVLIAVATLTAHTGQLALSARTQMPGPTLLADALAVAGAVLFGTVLIGVGSAVRTMVRRLSLGLRPVPRRVAALGLVPALVLTGSSAAAADGTALDITSSVSSTMGVKGAEFLPAR
jgi:uncharacterized membrane protein